MFKSNVFKPWLLFLFLFCLAFVFPGNSKNAFAAPPSPGQSDSQFDRIEMPPMPGQAYSGPEATPEDLESLPPAVKKMDEQIRRETKILKKGFEPVVTEQMTKAQPQADAEVVEKQIKPTSGVVSTRPGQEPAKQPGVPGSPSAKTSYGVSDVTGGQSPRPLKSSSAKSQQTARDIKSSKQLSDTKVKATAVKAKTKASKNAEVKTEAVDKKSNDIYSLLKRLIVFTLVGAGGFVLIRKFVFKS